MTFTLRVDLDYVPWDMPDAKEFGHGEPAVLVRLLDLARSTGAKLHFFASERVIRAFPTSIEAIRDDGHDLDWLCKHPEEMTQRWSAAQDAIEGFDVCFAGLALHHPWLPELDEVLPQVLAFCSGPLGPVPAGLRYFPVETRPDRDALRSGQTIRGWSDGVKLQVRNMASLNRGVTVVIRPQVMAKIDPGLRQTKEILDLALAVGLRVRTLRDILAEEATGSKS